MLHVSLLYHALPHSLPWHGGLSGVGLAWCRKFIAGCLDCSLERGLKYSHSSLASSMIGWAMEMPDPLTSRAFWSGLIYGPIPGVVWWTKQLDSRFHATIVCSCIDLTLMLSNVTFRLKRWRFPNPIPGRIKTIEMMNLKIIIIK